MLFWVVSWLFMSVAQAARVKDISDVQGVRSNKLIGYGLVTGLQRTGDTMRNQATIATVSKRLQGLGVTLTPEQIRSRNVAMVMVTADLPSTAQPGQTFNVVVSSTGDAISLQGGVLLLTQMLAPNGDAYAVAQGPLAIGGFAVDANGTVAQKNHATTGTVPLGGLVERGNPRALDLTQQDHLNFLLHDGDYTTANRMAEAINKAIGDEVARAKNETVIMVKIPQDYQKNVVSYLALVENVDIEVDSVARVTVNERTGTVVMGANVLISPVAVAHGGLSIEVKKDQNVSQPNPLGQGNTVQTESNTVVTEEEDGSLSMIGGNVTIGELVNALNNMGVTPRDLVQILITIKKSGAMQAELDLI